MSEDKHISKVEVYHGEVQKWRELWQERRARLRSGEFTSAGNEAGLGLRLLAEREELLALLLSVLRAGIIDIGPHAQECRFCSWWSRNDDDVPEHHPECDYVRALPFFTEPKARALLELIGGTARGGRQKL